MNQISINTITPSDSASENASTKESSRSGSSKKQTIPPKYYELEVGLLNQAITYLLDDQNCKTVVVDIFAQESGALKIDKDSGQIKTHAILLYKNPIIDTENIETKTDDLKDDCLRVLSTATEVHDIVVIDPSNSSYSSHLSNLTKDHITHTNFSQIFTIKKSIPIYTTPKDIKTGSAFDQYRDCIDIAVKLGFGFNNTDQFFSINTKDTQQIKNLDVIRKITNRAAIDNNIIDLKLINRIKQTSDYKIIEAFNYLEMVIKQNLNHVLVKSGTKHFEIYTHHHQILTDQSTAHTTLEQLLVCNKECLNIFEIEHNTLITLVGNIETNIELGEIS